MNPLCLTLAVLSLSAPVPKDIPPRGPAPFTLKTTAAEGGVTVGIKTKEPEGQLTIVENGTNGLKRTVFDQFKIRTFQASLTEIDGLKVYTAEGVELGWKAAVLLLDGGAAAVASADGRIPDVAHRRALKPGTLILVSPDLTRAAELASHKDGDVLWQNRLR